MDPRESADRAVQDLLNADAVLPEQFWGEQGVQNSAFRLTGERALMWAVLADGIDSYRRTAHATAPAPRMEFDDAERWVFTTDWDWPFSFVNLCEVFGFDPAGIRSALIRWKNSRAHVRRQRFRPVTLHAA